MDAVVYDEITTQVGKKDDVADDTGSLHAKIANIVDIELPKLQKPRGLHGAPGSFTTALTTYQTALSITGKGRLVYLAASTHSNSTGAVIIEIDGASVCMGSIGTTSGVLWFPDNSFPISYSGTFTSSGNSHLDLSFKESLVIQLKCNQGIGANVYWQYEDE